MVELADQLKLSRMAAVEEWRSKSFALGGPLGNVLARSYDLIHTVIRNGVTDEMTVGYALESLANERTLAMNRDVDRDDPIRQLVYGLTESLGTVLESIREGMQAPAQAAADQVDGPQQSGVSEHNDDGLPLFKEEEEVNEHVNDEAALLIAKEEQLELQHAQDHGENNNMKDEEHTGGTGQDDFIQPPTSSNAHDARDDAIESIATKDQDEDNISDEDEEMEEDEKDEEEDEEDDDEEKMKDEEPCTSAQAAARETRSRKRRRAFIDDEDEDEKDDVYSGESDTERSMTTDSRLRPRRKTSDEKRRSSRLCATGPKIYVDPDDNGQVTLSRRPVPVKMDEDEEETEEVDDHTCVQCDRKFDSARALSVHSRVHNVMEYPASSSGEDDDDFINDRDEEGEEEEVEEPVPWRLRVRERVTKTNKFIL